MTFVVLAPEEEEEPGVVGETLRLEKIEEFQLDEHNPLAFYYWLDRYFLREHKRKPDTESFLQDFGPESAAFRFASLAWMDAIAHYRHHSDFKVIYANWQKYLRTAYGTSVGDERLFVRHTYLATLAKLLAYIRITNAQDPPPENGTREILQGTFFEKQRILNFLEEDFFSWVGRDPVLSTSQQIVFRLVDLLFSYNLRELSEDVLKELYQGLVDPKDRHDLGEYYTPDWLAARRCAKMVGKSAKEAVLDPACGSGTFLYQAIQHKKKRLPHTRQSLQDILDTVVGIDIHPLAVIVSKMNVLLALGDLFQKRGGAVSIQVYLANSIRHPVTTPYIGAGGAPAERVELNDRQVLIPRAILATPGDLDAAVRLADEFAKSNKERAELDFEAFENLARRHSPSLCESPHVLRMLFDLSAALHEFIRKPEDTIWAYILKNLYKPTFLTKKFDIVIGNPPWLSFRYVERGDYQDHLKKLIVTDCGLLEGAGHLITHLELGTLFFVHCANLYLKRDGKIGFVLPRSIFTADQHDRFRRSLTSGNATLTEVWDLDGVSPLFNVPAAVAFGDVLSDASKTLPGEILEGKLKRKNATLAEAVPDLKVEETEFHVVEQGKRTFLSTKREKISARRSYYQPFFKEGATIVPRSFWFVEIKGDPRLGIDPEQPFVATDARAQAEAKAPYKDVRFEGSIESEFLYSTLLSTDLLPFGHFAFRPVVLPLMEDAHGFKLIDASEAQNKGFLKLAEWLRIAEETWNAKRGEKASRGHALHWLNYRNKLTDQDPKSKYVVLYPMSASYLCAAVVRRASQRVKVGEQDLTLRGFLADYKTFFFETTDHAEANYLASVLNSPVVDRLVKPMQSRGLWGPRDICKKVLELPIPQFKAGNRKHEKLTDLAQVCAEKAKDMVPELKKEFADMRGPHAIGRARVTVRKALEDELSEIDRLVRDILS